MYANMNKLFSLQDIKLLQFNLQKSPLFNPVFTGVFAILLQHKFVWNYWGSHEPRDSPRGDIKALALGPSKDYRSPSGRMWVVTWTCKRACLWIGNFSLLPSSTCQPVVRYNPSCHHQNRRPIENNWTAKLNPKMTKVRDIYLICRPAHKHLFLS